MLKCCSSRVVCCIIIDSQLLSFRWKDHAWWFGLSMMIGSGKDAHSNPWTQSTDFESFTIQSSYFKLSYILESNGPSFPSLCFSCWYSTPVLWKALLSENKCCITKCCFLLAFSSWTSHITASIGAPITNVPLKMGPLHKNGYIMAITHSLTDESTL